MKFNKFQNINVSALGFGCMRFPVTEGGKIDKLQLQQMVDVAIANGVNYFDTAWIYHDGESEGAIGEALKKHPKEKWILADKMPLWVVKKQEDIELIFEEQLKKCGVEYFDFYLLHSMDTDAIEKLEKFDAYNFLLKKKKEGKIKFLGFSMHDSPEFAEGFIKKYKFDFAQIQLNYLDWTAMRSKELYEVLTRAEIPIIVMEPVRGGALATLNEEASGILKTANSKASLASWALRFCASLPNVLVTLSGMSNQNHVEDNIRTFSNFKLITEEEKLQIERAKSAYLKNRFIRCTNCRYCMPCPFGVRIPDVFTLYNASSPGKKDSFDKSLFSFHYSNLDKSARADKCQRCGICVAKCPQKINIPEELEKIAKVAIEE